MTAEDRIADLLREIHNREEQLEHEQQARQAAERRVAALEAVLDEARAQLARALVVAA